MIFIKRVVLFILLFIVMGLGLILTPLYILLINMLKLVFLPLICLRLSEMILVDKGEDE